MLAIPCDGFMSRLLQIGDKENLCLFRFRHGIARGSVWRRGVYFHDVVHKYFDGPAALTVDRGPRLLTENASAFMFKAQVTFW
jgi:hypothetical protein